MVKKFINCKTDNTGYHAIIHAAPNKIGDFQWYLLTDPNSSNQMPIEGQTHESITFDEKWAKEWLENNHSYKCLACHCNVDGEQYDEFGCFLSDTFIGMIKNNDFDSVDFYDDKGMIKPAYVKTNGRDKIKILTGCHEINEKMKEITDELKESGMLNICEILATIPKPSDEELLINTFEANDYSEDEATEIVSILQREGFLVMQEPYPCVRREV